MDAATRQRLRGGFDSAATQYAGSRPGYPPEAVDWLVPEPSCDVLDLAAGSGALTRLLAPSHRVIAADPSRNLLGELRKSMPKVSATQATAEALPFAAASFDVITVATAFHWFDPDRSLPEIARALRPGGLLSLAWNTRDRESAFASELDGLLRSVRPPALKGDWGTGSVQAVVASPHFQIAESAEFPHSQRLDRDEAVGLAASRSYVIDLTPRRRQTLLAAVGDVFDRLARSGMVELPYRCQCWRAPRLSI